jgi:prepilin-type N-terminal cleavage/methylation domain-containing protein
MQKHKVAGFTLIELLAVIAIIGILAALIGVAAPRAIEKARITDVENDFNQIRTALTTYVADSPRGSYPPGYGYRIMTDQQIINAGGDPLAIPYDTTIPDNQLFYLGNYMVEIGLFKSFDLYDRFADSHNTDANPIITPLEYRPVGTPDPANPTQFIGFANNRYVIGNNPGEVGRMQEEQGPYIYIPVNRDHAEAYRSYCYAGYGAHVGSDPALALQYANGRFFDPADPTDPGGAGRTIGVRFIAPILAQLPPPKYDAFVLMSVGPVQDVHGLLPGPLSGMEPDQYLDAYYIMGLRAYYLATRDINNNGRLDFDFRTRTREAENATAFEIPQLANFPDGSGAQGPLIYVQEG